ncbi:MAG: hypothetical protein CMI33_05255 [Opitutales bacterium]|nr:hypothetical protein [Opitutales bacterium]
MPKLWAIARERFEIFNEAEATGFAKVPNWEDSSTHSEFFAKGFSSKENLANSFNFQKLWE